MNKKRALYALLTGGIVAVAYLLVTLLRIWIRGQSFAVTPWIAIFLIGAAFFVVSVLGATIASLVNRAAFFALSRRAVILASAISAAAISLLLNTDFPEPDSDWLMGAIILLIPVLFCTASLLLVGRLQEPNNRVQATRETRAPDA